MLRLPTGTTLDVLGPIVMSTILAIEQHLLDVLLLSFRNVLHLLLPLDAFTFHYNYWLVKLHLGRRILSKVCLEKTVESLDLV